MKRLPLLMLSFLALTSCQSTIKKESQMNILDTMKKQSTNELLVLTLNLHTYQEKDAQAKLDYVADVIAYLDVDLVAFQECAQHKDSAPIDFTLKSDNMAYLITKRLKKVHRKKYYFIWDWAHFGWSVWEEGVAILSKEPITAMDSRYVSSAQKVNLIDSRKVIFAETTLAPFGKMHLYSAHLSWRKTETDQEQNRQVQRLHNFVELNSMFEDTIPLICGDFNMSAAAPPPFNEAYTIMTNHYIDSYLAVHPDANRNLHSHKTIADRGRIDYIFSHPGSPLEIVDSHIIFKSGGLGLVSDHQGVLTRFKLKK